MNNMFRPIDSALRKLLDGYSHLLFIKGRAGIGKSYRIQKFLDTNKVVYTEVAGDISAAYLYQLLYENNKKIIWFRDVNRLLRDLRSLEVLKCATETEPSKRIITNYTYSHEKRELPNKFLVESPMIFDYNAIIPKFKDDFEALKTRGDFIELHISEEDVAELMLSIADTDSEKEVTDFLLTHHKAGGLDLLNLRVQQKAFQTYKYCEKHKLDWKKELIHELKYNMSPIRTLLYSFMGRKATKVSEIKKWLVRNGYFNSLRTTDRRIHDWIELEELFVVSKESKGYYVCLWPTPLKGHG